MIEGASSDQAKAMGQRTEPPQIIVREVALSDTRPLRQAVLRPHQSVESLSAEEPADAFAVGAFVAEICAERTCSDDASQDRAAAEGAPGIGGRESDAPADPESDAPASGMRSGERLIAVGFIAPEGEPFAWRIRSMATSPQLRSAGAGSAILERLIGHAIAHGARRIWCNARTPARIFYQRAGFQVVSEEFVIPNIGAHFIMERRRLPVAHAARFDARAR